MNFLKFLYQHRIFHHKNLVHTSFGTKCMISWWSIAFFVHFPIFWGVPPLQGLWRHLVNLTYLKKKITCQFIKPIKFLNFCKKLEFKIFRSLWDIKKTPSNPYRFFYREMGVSRPCFLVVRGFGHIRRICWWFIS